MEVLSHTALASKPPYYVIRSTSKDLVNMRYTPFSAHLLYQISAFSWYTDGWPHIEESLEVFSRATLGSNSSYYITRSTSPKYTELVNMRYILSSAHLLYWAFLWYTDGWPSYTKESLKVFSHATLGSESLYYITRSTSLKDIDLVNMKHTSFSAHLLY